MAASGSLFRDSFHGMNSSTRKMATAKFQVTATPIAIAITTATSAATSSAMLTEFRGDSSAVPTAIAPSIKAMLAEMRKKRAVVKLQRLSAADIQKICSGSPKKPNVWLCNNPANRVRSCFSLHLYWTHLRSIKNTQISIALLFQRNGRTNEKASNYSVAAIFPSLRNVWVTTAVPCSINHTF